MHGLPRLLPAVTAASLLATGFVPAAHSQSAGDATPKPAVAQPVPGSEQLEARSEARHTVEKAAEIIRRMESHEELSGLLERAQGLFVVPALARGAFILGAEGGRGLLIGRQNGAWTAPVFYTLGSLSLGIQAGGQEGSLVMILMSDQALQRFLRDDSFSISADAGLTIVNLSASTQADLAGSDVVVWSDMTGAFVGAAIRVSDVGADEEANRSFYGDGVTPQAILSGQAQSQHSEALREALQP